MTGELPTKMIGCLLDVSRSMRKTLETGQGDNHAIERLEAVLSAALKFAQSEQRRGTSALVFVGLFGLNRTAGYPPVVDLCGVVEALLISDNADAHRSGHDLLIELANEKNLPHIGKYIRTKLSDHEALIVHAYLRRHPERTDEFVSAIPEQEQIQTSRTMAKAADGFAGAAVGVSALSLGPVGLVAFGIGGAMVSSRAVEAAEDHAVDNSEALRLAREICDQWLQDFTTFVPRPVNRVVHILERLQDRRGGASQGTEDNDTLLEALRRYMYGRTPMREALMSSLAAFRECPLAARGGSIQQRALLVISDGAWTGDDPLPTAVELRNHEVTIAAMFLTCDEKIPRRRLIDNVDRTWHRGQRVLFNMASKILCATHPVPVLASVGWEVPSSGECALYTSVCSTSALEEFCSLLSSARFGSADTLLDIVGRMDLDAYIDDKHIRTKRGPSDQGERKTCYAHAIAAVAHMALLRIVGREGGCPSIREIRQWILRDDNFPETPNGWSVMDVLEVIPERYRPLRFREVDEEGARQAVLHRRPVLATFQLSKDGWETFGQHFGTAETCASVLAFSKMAQHRNSPPDESGHAVVLTGCDPVSLTFLNSWGRDWGNSGSFSIEKAAVLELDGQTKTLMEFYDVYWLESDLKDIEREAYNAKVDEKLHSHSSQFPSIFELETRCPLCLVIAPIAKFSGNMREATCPTCSKSFYPEPGHLVQALYARAGLNG